jgi:hypothetical protein
MHHIKSETLSVPSFITSITIPSSELFGEQRELENFDTTTINDDSYITCKKF